MPTDEIIIRLFCIVADTLSDDKKRRDAHLYPSEIVTIGLVFALKGGKFRAFYRWLKANYQAFFPCLPERACNGAFAIIASLPQRFWSNLPSLG